ncbi:MAG: AzlD domain-containing protein [Clostridia bacterium]|nr:AzlD domain-containing protein [Clostridia bacterium]
MNNTPFFLYLLLMAGVTYLIRMLPLVLIKKKITNRTMLSFLHYIPYTVLAVMTVPAIFSSTSSVVSATTGFIVAIVLALKNKSLLTVAAFSSLTVLVVEWLINKI